ncbi:hypothetical protein [Geodermatophilus normandii]|uniref:Uncharacterized protein n=1 Tax=Geodermatophilus normandii TaxID=1137989 RepID=A0A6P0GN86_9ACTN|nr:hypothetical protein [Geodermatophilus normandii]NEM08835.1 hypothetical protein [Geodermatophilus normandii]
MDGRRNQLLCNGCYGRVLSLWEVKAGEFPDAERDDAIVNLLSASVTAEQIGWARERLAAAKLFNELSPQAQQMLATAEAVTGVLKTATGLDWSAAVIGLCKAVESEIAIRLIEPLRRATTGIDLAADLADKDLSRVARYCAGLAPAPELGSLAHTLGAAARSRRRVTTSPLLKVLHDMVAAWPDGRWILATDGLMYAASRLGKEFRNPAAHTGVLSEDDYEQCRLAVQGEGGLLSRLVTATPTQSR